MSLLKSRQTQLSSLEREEKAADATMILNHPVFQEAMDAVYSRAEGILLTTDIGGLTASSAHAIMKAVKEIQNQLQAFIIDDKLSKKYPKKSGEVSND